MGGRGGTVAGADQPYFIERLAKELVCAVQVGDVDFLGQGVTDLVLASSDLMTAEPTADPDAVGHQHQYDNLFSATEATPGAMGMDGTGGFADGCEVHN